MCYQQIQMICISHNFLLLPDDDLTPEQQDIINRLLSLLAQNKPQLAEKTPPVAVLSTHTKVAPDDAQHLILAICLSQMMHTQTLPNRWAQALAYY